MLLPWQLERSNDDAVPREALIDAEGADTGAESWILEEAAQLDANADAGRGWSSATDTAIPPKVQIEQTHISVVNSAWNLNIFLVAEANLPVDEVGRVEGSCDALLHQYNVNHPMMSIHL